MDERKHLDVDGNNASTEWQTGIPKGILKKETPLQTHGWYAPLSIPSPTQTALSDLQATTDGRLVQKRGAYNISCRSERKDEHYRMMADVFTTLVETRWRYVVLLFVAVFTVGWIAFALIWWGVIVAHEDDLHKNDTDWKPCLSNIYNFPDALLFSIDLQSTMGYGFGEIETECTGAVLLFMIQCVFGVFVECIATGVVFAKLIRPKRRYQTIMFSDRAVIARLPNSGLLGLQFRVGDMRRRCLIDASVSAILVKADITGEGEEIPLSPHILELQSSSEDESAFLLWPETITHVLDESSPLAGLTEESLRKEAEEKGFEIVVLLEGTDDTTGMATQLRTSYLPSEILFGYHMMPLPMLHLPNGQFSVDYSKFNAVYKENE